MQVLESWHSTETIGSPTKNPKNKPKSVSLTYPKVLLELVKEYRIILTALVPDIPEQSHTESS